MSRMSEDLFADILSVADLHEPERLAAISRALDAFPEFAPTVMGRRDPPRTPVHSVEHRPVEWAPTIHPGTPSRSSWLGNVWRRTSGAGL